MMSCLPETYDWQGEANELRKNWNAATGRIAALEAENATLRTDLNFANIEAKHQKETVVSLYAALKHAERELAEMTARWKRCVETRSQLDAKYVAEIEAHAATKCALTEERALSGRLARALEMTKILLESHSLQFNSGIWRVRHNSTTCWDSFAGFVEAVTSKAGYGKVFDSCVKRMRAAIDAARTDAARKENQPANG